MHASERLVVSGFTTETLLGRGGFGEVWASIDEQSGERVAIKWQPRTASLDWLTLKREFQVLALLSHPNLVELYRLEVLEHGCWMSMQLVEGTPLDTVAPPPPTLWLVWMRQLVQGVRVLHDAGFTHGDIKPSNILVDDDGQHLTLIDLGLSARLGARRELEGTLLYLAPECHLGNAPVQASTDWYGVGLVLMEVLLTEPLCPNLGIEACHPQLATTPCTPLQRGILERLLATDPACRPDGEELVRWLDSNLGATPAPTEVPFLSRSTQAATVRTWIRRAAGGQRVVGFVEGDSGSGKTTLLRRVAIDGKEVEIVRGAVHPHAAIPFGGADALLTLLLEGVESGRLSWRPPASVGAVFQAFAPYVTDPGPAESRGRHEQRRRAYAAISEGLAELCEQRPLLYWLDDAQWCDGDSLALLRRVFARSRRLSAVFTHRPPAGGDEGFASYRLYARGLAHAEFLSLSPLDPSEADDPQVAAVIVAADGDPMHVGEILRRRRPEDHQPSLGWLIQRAVSELDPSAADMLRWLAALEVPVPRTLILSIFGSRAGASLSLLNQSRLTRHEIVGNAPGVVVAHARIAAAVLSAVSDLESMHRRIASDLERVGADPRLTIHQLIQAGAWDLASAAASAEADRARDAHAFSLEAALRLQVIDLVDRPTSEALEALGHAWSNCGAADKAAQCFALAAEAVPVAEPGRNRLRRLSGEHHIRSGNVEAGRATLWSLIRDLGGRPPGSEFACFVRIALLRLWVLVRGLRVAAPRAVDPTTLDRMDAEWSTATSLALLDHVASEAMLMGHLVAALSAGEHSRAWRALGYEAVFLGRFGWRMTRHRSLELADRVREAGRTIGDHYDHAWSCMSAGTAYWLADDWSEAADALSEALDLWERDCIGVHFERMSTCAILSSAYYYLADFEAFRDVVGRIEHEVAALGNRFPLDVGMFDNLSIGALLDGDSDAALAWIERAWVDVPETKFRVARFTRGHSRARVHLYEGRFEDAHRETTEGWKHVRAANVHWVESFRLDLLYRRAQSCISLAGRRTGHERRSLYRAASSDLARIRRIRLPPAAPWALCIQAGLHFLDGDDEARCAALQKAEDGFTQAAMPLFSLCTRRARTAGPERAEAHSALQALGIADPQAWQRALIPAMHPSDP